MPNATIPLLYACSFAGLVMVIGGIWLIAKEKIYIDRETRQVTAIELPFGVKFQTNLPALALFVLGFVPLIYPLPYASQLVDEVLLKGEVAGDDFPVEVLAVVDSELLWTPRDFSISVPRIDSRQGNYKVLYVAASNPILDGRLDLDAAADGVLPVPQKALWRDGQQDYLPQLQPVPKEFRQDVEPVALSARKEPR